MSEVKQIWTYKDQNYDTREAALEAERIDRGKKKSRLEKLLDPNTGYHKFSGPISTVGYWKIEDEGPLDWGYSGQPRQLAVFYGTYLEACQYALTLNGFWGYGPGRVTPLDVVNDPTNKVPSIVEWAKTK